MDCGVLHRVVYKSRQPAKFAGFSARFRRLLSLLHESKHSLNMSKRWTHNRLLFTKLRLLKNLKKTLITTPAQRIFVKIEKHFRLLTPNINLQGINLSGITCKAITDSDILSNFDLMVADASIESGSHVRKDVLFSIVKLC